MRNRFILGVIGLTALLFAGCTKDPARQLEGEETSVYITNRAEGVGFGQYASFALSDSVVVLQNNQLVDRVRTEYDGLLINAIAGQMQQRGFVRVAQGDDPDLGITVSRIYNDFTGIVNYFDYWGYYGGWWDPFYWGYPGLNYGFPGFFGTYTITDGAVAVDMIDLKNANANGQLRAVWSGLIRGTGTFAPARAEAHAAALFAQSPYISTP